MNRISDVITYNHKVMLIKDNILTFPTHKSIIFSNAYQINCRFYVMILKKPKKLVSGDTVALVSPSAGLTGEKDILYRTNIGIDYFYHIL